MICPQCGRWNRAALPKCFFCGAALPDEQTDAAAPAQPTRPEAPRPSAAVIYDVTEDGRGTVARPDEKDRLADEMQSFHIRRARGKREQQRFLQQTAQENTASTTRSVRIETNRTRTYLGEAEEQQEGIDRPGVDPAPRFTRNIPQYGDQVLSDDQPLWSDEFRRGASVRKTRGLRMYGLLRVLPVFAIILLACAVLGGGYEFLLKPLLTKEKEPEAEVEIIPSLLGDMAAHIIRIPAEDGAQIYIKELRKAYIAAGGYAEISVADYTWYELKSDIEDETMEVTLTPFIKTSAGEQKLMDTITYTIDIPLSPLAMITPDTDYLEVTTTPYNVQFRVAQNSTVFINGEDFSSYVNTQDGYISYNAMVGAVGENVFDIVVNCQYYRQNKKTITLYRAPQDIPLEVDSRLGNTSANQLMKISGTTTPGVTLTVNSPYEDLDTSELASKGNFSFMAKFTTIGNNVISITVSKDDKTTTLEKQVYYVPYASTYTPKAWPMDATNYIDFLNNLNVRVARTQIYVCEGVITEVLSSKPQLALMDTGTEGSERLVLLENMSRDTWEIGERYRVFADAFGVYDGKPRLVGRYTYPAK